MKRIVIEWTIRPGLDNFPRILSLQSQHKPPESPHELMQRWTPICIGTGTTRGKSDMRWQSWLKHNYARCVEALCPMRTDCPCSCAGAPQIRFAEIALTWSGPFIRRRPIFVKPVQNRVHHIVDVTNYGEEVQIKIRRMVQALGPILTLMVRPTLLLGYVVNLDWSTIGREVICSMHVDSSRSW